MTDEGRSSQVSVPEAPEPDRERGRGLLITDMLATRWGQHQTSSGLTVWVEVDHNLNVVES
ncbi:hypothetical protein [Streptomyces sp. NPDC086182]|uniref:hypothetical protein n=1 Tax=Streptomyces sp. NPDC086182 TaxID=3155058 RepID=UPI0034170681